MELALGTVQFGLAYGVAGRGTPVPPDEARSILNAAWDAGVRRVDTAPAYGDIEARLAGLCGALDFSIVSKIPTMPPGLDAVAAAQWLRQSVETSRQRLGDRLCGLIFHDASLPIGLNGQSLCETLSRAVEGTRILVGASHYAAESIPGQALWPEHRMAQFPGNAYDQRVTNLSSLFAGTEVSLRSVFLQGLLLMDPEQGARRVPAGADWLDDWSKWCANAGVSRLEGALSIVKGFTEADYCLIGVDSVAQLAEVATAWAGTSSVPAPELAGTDPNVFDPRLWQS